MQARTNLFALVSMLVALCACSADDAGGVPSGMYRVDPAHTYLTFSYLHQGLSYPLLRATSVDGELDYDAGSLAGSTVKIDVAADSIRSNIDYFDKELASRKFFHADKFPTITFRSERFEETSENTGTLHGELTIKDVTHPISLDVTLNNAIVHPLLEIPVLGFSATGSLLRSEFGLDRFVPQVSDEVTFDVQIELLHDGGSS